MPRSPAPAAWGAGTGPARCWLPTSGQGFAFGGTERLTGLFGLRCGRARSARRRTGCGGGRVLGQLRRPATYEPLRRLIEVQETAPARAEPVAQHLQVEGGHDERHQDRELGDALDADRAAHELEAGWLSVRRSQLRRPCVGRRGGATWWSRRSVTGTRGSTPPAAASLSSRTRRRLRAGRLWWGGPRSPSLASTAVCCGT